jgi:Fe2+ or Zn2+ uptake regulation protein
MDRCKCVPLWLFVNETCLKTVILKSSDLGETDMTLSYLKKVKYLTIDDDYYLSSLIGLESKEGEPDIFSVKLVDLENLEDFTPLNGIKKLEINNCDCFYRSNGLENIQHLVIVNCKDFYDDCSLLLENIHSLILEQLPYLNLLKGKGLKNLRFLKIVDCSHLMDIDIIPSNNLSHKQFIVIETCRKINEQDKLGKFEEMKKKFYSFKIDHSKRHTRKKDKKDREDYY